MAEQGFLVANNVCLTASRQRPVLDAKLLICSGTETTWKTEMGNAVNLMGIFLQEAFAEDDETQFSSRHL